jgi:hypothetical protein
MLSSTNAETHWGNPASYAIEVSSRNGFAGTVTLTPQNLPFGASSAPASVSVPINGSTTANLTITTINGGTALGQHSFPLRAESPGVVADVRTLDLHVLPAEGAFGPLSWLLLVPRSCDSVNADITTDPADPNGGPAVKFQGNSFASGALPVAYYAYTPDCRGAVVFSPSTVQGNPVHIVNLKFPNQIADPPGHSYRLNPAAYNQNQFRVGGDGSYLIVADESGGSGHATLWNMLDLSQTPSSHQYSIAGALNAQIAGNMVEVSDSVGGSFNWVLP